MSRHKPGVTPAMIIVIIVSLLLIIGLIKNAIGLYQSRNRLESTQAKVVKLTQTEQMLQKSITLQAEPGSMDQIMRDKLNLALPGETIIIINSSDSSFASSSSFLLSTSDTLPTPTYLQWWQLINPTSNF